MESKSPRRDKRDPCVSERVFQLVCKGETNRKLSLKNTVFETPSYLAVPCAGGSMHLFVYLDVTAYVDEHVSYLGFRFEVLLQSHHGRYLNLTPASRLLLLFLVWRYCGVVYGVHSFVLLVHQRSRTPTLQLSCRRTQLSCRRTQLSASLGSDFDLRSKSTEYCPPHAHRRCYDWVAARVVFGDNDVGQSGVFALHGVGAHKFMARCDTLSLSPPVRRAWRVSWGSLSASSPKMAFCCRGFFYWFLRVDCR